MSIDQSIKEELRIFVLSTYIALNLVYLFCKLLQTLMAHHLVDLGKGYLSKLPS